MLPPDPEKPHGLSGFFSSLNPLQQGGVILGGLATAAALVMPVLFSDGLPLFGAGGDKAGAPGAFARKDAPAPKSAEPAPAGEPAASPLPMPGQALSSVMRPGSGGGPLSAGLAPGGAPDAGGAGATAFGAAPGARRGGPLGPQGMVVDGGAAPGGSAGKGPGRGVALEPTAPLLAIPPGGSSGGGGGGAPVAGAPQGGEGLAGGSGAGGPRGGGMSSDGGLHETRQNALGDPASGAEADEEDDSRCEPGVRARFDAMIDQKFDAYIRTVADRRSSGCQGIPCSWLDQNQERCAKGRLSNVHQCRCARMACKQDEICRQGNQIRCQKLKACAANPQASCEGFKCDLDPS